LFTHQRVIKYLQHNTTFEGCFHYILYRYWPM
jgi:hypothetical protein